MNKVESSHPACKPELNAPSEWPIEPPAQVGVCPDHHEHTPFTHLHKNSQFHFSQIWQHVFSRKPPPRLLHLALVFVSSTLCTSAMLAVIPPMFFLKQGGRLNTLFVCAAVGCTEAVRAGNVSTLTRQISDTTRFSTQLQSAPAATIDSPGSQSGRTAPEPCTPEEDMDAYGRRSR